MGYYRRVSETIKDGFQDKLEQGQFLDNVFDHMEGEEVKLCQNQTVSFILEELLLLASPSQIGRFLGSALEGFEVILADRFAGHVVQRALFQAVKCFDDEGEGAELQEKVLAMAERLQSSLDSLMMDTYGSYVLRTMLQVLGGVRVPDQVSRSKLSMQHQKNETRKPDKKTEVLLENVPESMQLKLKLITNLILKADNFNEFLLNRTSSPVLGVMLLVLHQSSPKLCLRLCQKILQKSKVMTPTADQAEKKVPVVFADVIGSRLFEVVLQVISSDLLSEVFPKCFSKHLVDMALHPVANFVFQKLITRAAQEEEFLEIFRKMCPNIEAILGVNHMGVVRSLAEACMHHPDKQNEFLQAVLSAFHCWEPKERQSTCVRLIAGMATHEVFFKQATESEESDEPKKSSLTNVDYHGAVLLQQMLKFTHCGPVIAGFLSMTEDDLGAVACSVPGSYLLQAFMACTRVNEKRKERFALKLKTHCVKIACHKTGSHLIENIFKAVSIKTKRVLCEALAEKSRQLQNDFCGKFVYKNLAVDLFKNRRQDWEDLQGKTNKKRELFADIIDDDEPAGKKKKKLASEDTEMKHLPYSEEIDTIGMEEEGDATEETPKEDEIDEIFGKADGTSSNKKNKRRKRSSHSKTDVTETSGTESARATGRKSKDIEKEDSEPTDDVKELDDHKEGRKRKNKKHKKSIGT
ncbi:nucleolar protein 9-like [Asterias amurensis]|uniref:nucleolar protein 9-like n=1 Tax=Asterias amurensis TaxID=7602 RepID=UPI003AB6D0AA